ncbi:MAG TPA: dihydroorotate dehydrogenase [Candidatus Polarisedimenticolia bacterium]|nr:dihydroorotate dehydrogenase [Candidatus Polarisedimenticolia bacterium]
MSAAAAGPVLAVSAGPLALKNPVMTASGTCGYGVDLLPHLELSALGGIVCKSLSLKPREGSAPCRIAETPAGMLNAIGLQNIGVEAFLRDKLPELRRHDVAVVANIFGETVQEFAQLARALDGADGIAAVELNISCPNTAKGGIEFGVDPEATARVTEAVKAATRRPVIVKLSPNVTDITLIARAAAAAGADILSLVNTFVGMAVDVQRGRPILASGAGGLSGPAIRPLAVLLTYRVARAVSIPLIGLGGIRSGADALEFIMAGASAVQVGTATFTEPGAAARIVREMEEHCRRHGVASIASLIGAAHQHGAFPPEAGPAGTAAAAG